MTYLDKHYLYDKDLLQLISSSLIIRNKIVLEIGVGKLTLTKFLIDKKPKRLIGCDLDNSNLEFISKFEKENSNFDFILENALTLIKKETFQVLFGNIPYSITEPLFKKILEVKVNKYCLLFGYKFYKNIICNEYNLLGVFINCFYNITQIKEVNGDKFEPTTKVKSVISKFELKKELTEKDVFFQILYSKTNRNLENSLIFTFVDYFKISKKDAKKKLFGLKIPFEISKIKLYNLSRKDLKIIMVKLLEEFQKS